MSRGYVERNVGSKLLPEDVRESLQARIGSESGPVTVRQLTVDVPAGPLEVRVECKSANGGAVMVGQLRAVSRFGSESVEPYDILTLLPKGETNPKRTRPIPLEAVASIHVGKGPGPSSGTIYVPIYVRQ